MYAAARHGKYLVINHWHAENSLTFAKEMKKLVLILLTCVYSFATMGISMRQFYCCGTLKSVSLSILQESDQGCNKDAEESGCCKNKFQYFKVNDKHVASDGPGNVIKPFVELHTFLTVSRDRSIAFFQARVPHRSNAPPLYSSIPAYLYNCTFRI